MIALYYFTYPIKDEVINQHKQKVKMTTTTYQEMRKKLGTRRGRKPLSVEERQLRQEKRKIEVRRRMEAKRRAWFVLENKYSTEFQKIFQEEYETLKKSKKFATK